MVRRARKYISVFTFGVLDSWSLFAQAFDVENETSLTCFNAAQRGWTAPLGLCHASFTMPRQHLEAPNGAHNVVVQARLSQLAPWMFYGALLFASSIPLLLARLRAASRCRRQSRSMFAISTQWLGGTGG